MTESCLRLRTLRPILAVVAALTCPLICLGEDTSETRVPSDLARHLEQGVHLGGVAEVVDGRVRGVAFQAIEKLISGDAPNEVILPTVSNESFAIIKSFPQMKWLRLSDANIGDAGMVHIVSLTELEVLSLRRTNVTEEALKHLEHCRRLRYLDLMGMDLSPDGLKMLATNMQLAHVLEVLHLQSSTIDDQGAAALTSFPSLRVLRLSHTNIGDGAVVHLRKLKKLEVLEVNSTKITSRGAAALRSALPKTKVVTEDPPP